MRCALLLMMAACSGDPKDSAAPADDTAAGVDPLSWDVTQPGPYNTGHVEITAAYTTAAGEAREVPVHVWYPTEDTSGAAVTYSLIFPDAVSLGGATPAPPVHDGGYPVLVHSHGHYGVAGGVSFLAQRAASQGWVVIAPEHVGNTLEEGLLDPSAPSPTAHWLERPGDVSAALDAVVAGDVLAGPLRSDATGLSGHSRGAYTAWVGAGAALQADLIEAGCAGESELFDSRSCTSAEQDAFLSGELDDPRFISTIVFAGTIRRAMFGDTGHRSVHSPFLAMTGTNDGPDGPGQFDSMDGIDFRWVEVEGGCHESFNLGVEASSLQPCETLDVDQGWALTATYALAFLRHTVLGDESAQVVGILDGSTAVDPVASIQRKVP
jgi:predicted dienelactone hydrolase